MRNLQEVQNKQKLSLNALKTLLRYLWPKKYPELKARFVGALALLLLSKAVNVSVPIFYKKAVDTLSTPITELIIVPVSLLIAYGIARILAQAFNELKDALFAKTAQHAIRTAGLRDLQTSS